MIYDSESRGVKVVRWVMSRGIVPRLNRKGKECRGVG